MKINIEIDNKMLNSIMDDAIERLEEVCEKEFKKCCEEIVSDAKTLCPVDTGTLRRSIHAEFNHSTGVWSALIGSDLEYAYWVENGHGTVSKNSDGKHAFKSFVPGNPFLRTAIAQNEEFIKQYLADEISKALGGSNS